MSLLILLGASAAADTEEDAVNAEEAEINAAEDEINADTADNEINAAAEYTGEIAFPTRRRAAARVTDGSIYTFQKLNEPTEITAEHPFTQLYIIWRDLPGRYRVKYNGKRMTCGKDGFLHELITLPEPVSSIVISCNDGWMSELRVFSDGELPDDVQVWEPADGKADMLVFPTHADDDCLFFGAFIADAVERGLSVQLAFMTVHSSGRHPDGSWDRDHERLNGMWEMGLTRYPVYGGFEDLRFDYIFSAQRFFGVENVEAWQVETIRRFKPEIVLAHDLDGEYGHTAHALNGRCLTVSVLSAADCTQYPESFEKYGVWQARKLYVHLSTGRELDLEVNTPLDSFGGRTAFEVAQDAYWWHFSQQIWDFSVSQTNRMYNCRLFGLAYSAVGPDTGNDYTEHLTFLKDQKTEQENG